MSSTLSLHGEIRNAFQLSVGECKRPLERWKYNTKGNLKEVCCDRVDWIPLAQDEAKKSSGCISSERDLDQQSNSHPFYQNLISGIIHSLDYHHFVFKNKI
jgi:hypothetical protein